MFEKVCSYSRKEKQYLVATSDDQLFSFPHGVEGKQEAFQFWIGYEYPTMHDEIENTAYNFAHVERMAWKAAELVISGAVSLDSRPGVAAMVLSSDHYGRYAVISEGGYLVCNCKSFNDSYPQFIENKAGEPVQVCKHILAVWFKRLIN